jgi:hypothetical protein
MVEALEGSHMSVATLPGLIGKHTCDTDKFGYAE